MSIEDNESLRDDLMLAAIRALENSTDPDDKKLWRRIVKQFDRLVPCHRKREVDGEMQGCETISLERLLESHLPRDSYFPQLPHSNRDRQRAADASDDVLKRFFSKKPTD